MGFGPVSKSFYLTVWFGTVPRIIRIPTGFKNQACFSEWKGSSKNEQLGSHFQLYHLLPINRCLPARLNSLPSETACRSSPPDGNMCCPLSAFSHWSTGKKSRWRVRVNFQASSLANVFRMVNFCRLQIRFLC